MIDDGFAYIGDCGFDFHDDDTVFWRLVVRVAIKDSVVATEDIIQENIFGSVVVGVDSSESRDSGVVETRCWVVGCWLNANFLVLTLVEDCSRNFSCEGEQVFHCVDVPVEDERFNVAWTKTVVDVEYTLAIYFVDKEVGTCCMIGRERVQPRLCECHVVGWVLCWW